MIVPGLLLLKLIFERNREVVLRNYVALSTLILCRIP